MLIYGLLILAGLIGTVLSYRLGKKRGLVKGREFNATLISQYEQTLDRAGLVLTGSIPRQLSDEGPALSTWTGDPTLAPEAEQPPGKALRWDERRMR